MAMPELSEEAKTLLLGWARSYVWWKTAEESFDCDNGQWLCAAIMAGAFRHPEHREELVNVVGVEYLRETLQQHGDSFSTRDSQQFGLVPPRPCEEWEYWHRRLKLIQPNEAAPAWVPRPGQDRKHER